MLYMILKNGGGFSCLTSQSLQHVSGLGKASPAGRKRLLRRTVKEVVVDREVMNITFWISHNELMDALPESASAGQTIEGKVVVMSS
jgi:hypothetical protein